jgi:hypothetical protein
MDRKLIILAASLAGLAFTPYLPFFGPAGSPCGVTDWAQRVVNNGGAMPSQNTICAVETLRTTLITLGVTNKIYSMCNFVPDSVIASATPLFTHKGYPMWTNNFSSAHLSVHGLKSFGTNFMDTGITAVSGEAVSPAGSGGLSVIVTEFPRSATYTLNANGQCLIGRSDADDDPRWQLLVDGSKNCYFFPGDVGSAANYMNILYYCPVGYISANITSNGVANIFVANPYENHRLLVTKSGIADDITAVANTITVFGNKRGTTNELITVSTNRMSMAMLHQDFTETESSNVWRALLTFRTQLGGGTGSPVHDWNTFIVAQGGAAISSTTSNAACLFWSRLNEAGIGTEMKSVNIVAPDSLQAFLTPLIWRAGHPVNQNNGFAVSNLSVFGANPLGTKFLRTGISNTTTQVPFNNSGGITVVATNQSGQIGGTTGAGNTHFTLVPATVPPVGYLYQFFAYSSATLNTTYVNGTNFFGGSTNYGMFTSGNRLSNDTVFVYVAAQSVPHYSITNIATITSQLAPDQEIVTFGSMQDNSPLTFQGWGPGDISYTAIHGGFSLNQSSNHYNAVYELRTALGGGNR